MSIGSGDCGSSGGIMRLKSSALMVAVEWRLFALPNTVPSPFHYLTGPSSGQNVPKFLSPVIRERLLWSVMMMNI